MEELRFKRADLMDVFQVSITTVTGWHGQGHLVPESSKWPFKYTLGTVDYFLADCLRTHTLDAYQPPTASQLYHKSDQLLTTAEVGAILGVSANTVEFYAKNGLPAYELPVRLLRYPASGVAAFKALRDAKNERTRKTAPPQPERTPIPPEEIAALCCVDEALVEYWLETGTLCNPQHNTDNHGRDECLIEQLQADGRLCTLGDAADILECDTADVERNIASKMLRRVILPPDGDGRQAIRIVAADAHALRRRWDREERW